MAESDYSRPPTPTPYPPVSYTPVMGPYPPVVGSYPPPPPPVAPVLFPPKPKIFLPTALKDSIRFFQVPARRWWWALIALVVYAVSYLIMQVIAGGVLVTFDKEGAASNFEVTTPTGFLISNVSIAASVPLAVLVSWLFFRQGFGWLVSVTGRFRWKWLAITMGVFASGYAVKTAVDVVVYGPDGYGLTDLQMLPTTWVMLIGILVTTPLQCAGEEFEFRAMLARLVAGIVPFRWVGLALSAIVTSGVFMLVHGADDLWLNIYYLGVGLMMWWLAYRTGGIEACIGFHIVNNIFAEWTMPFSDISDFMDRSAGTGSALVLIDLGVQLALVLIVDALARRRGLVRMSSPAAAIPEVVQPRRLFTRLADVTRPATIKELPRMANTLRDIPLQWQPAPPQPATAPHSAAWYVPPIPNQPIPPYLPPIPPER